MKTSSSVSQAAALVEEETRRYRPTKNYLSYLATPDFSAFEVGSVRLPVWPRFSGRNLDEFFFVILYADGDREERV